MNSRMCTTSAATFITLFFISVSSFAQTGSYNDFLDKDLDELTRTDVVRTDALGSHTHLEGEWMLGYSYMFMRMDGSLEGTSNVSTNDILQDFPVAPTHMDMEMHMPMLMYGVTDDLTLMVMAPIHRKAMDHVTRTGVRFTTKSEGLGDVELGTLYTFYRYRFDRHRLILDARFSVPTGSIDEKDELANPALGKLQLPYPMQLGSGTVDLLPALLYLGEIGDWAWKSEAKATIRLGENRHDYTLGDRFHLGTSVAWSPFDWIAPYVNLDFKVWGNVRGSDPALTPAVVPTADPDSRGGRSVDLSLGLNFYIPKGTLKGNSFAIEGGFPILEDLDGPQLETDWTIRAGWQWTF